MRGRRLAHLRWLILLTPAAALAQFGATPEALGTFTARTPVKPVSLAALATEKLGGLEGPPKPPALRAGNPGRFASAGTEGISGGEA